MKTFPRVIEVLQGDIRSGKSINAIVKKTGLTHNTIGAYLEGRAEPSQSSLEKLSHVYGKSVAWMRGDSDLDIIPEYIIKPDVIELSSLSEDKRAAWDVVNNLPAKKVRKLLDLLDLLETTD